MAKYSLVGVNGNAFSIMGYVEKAMRAEGKSAASISKYKEEAKSSDYDNLVAVSQSVIDRLNSYEHA